MADQLTCGQGLAQNAPLRTKLGELVARRAGAGGPPGGAGPGDEDAGPERRAYQRLAQEHREVGARLLVLGEEMAGCRDLPMGRHDRRVMASVPAVEAFEGFVPVEQELLALLQQRVPQDRRMLEQLREGGEAT